MPRISNLLLRSIHSSNPLLLPLYRTTRDLRSARNELRWLAEHVDGTIGIGDAAHEPSLLGREPLREAGPLLRRVRGAKLKQLCHERGRGVPLQYLLGSEYFGDLEILCRRGVLIPRPETADIVTALVLRLCQAVIPRTLRILDLCSGSGCISFLLHYLFRRRFGQTALTTLGIDTSPRAIRLALENRARLQNQNLIPTAPGALRFARADVLRWEPTLHTHVAPLGTVLGNSRWDIIIANPPYISPRAHSSSTTARSVRCFEPRAALVPPATVALQSRGDTGAEARQEDVFYASILKTAVRVGAKLVLFEVGDFEQAVRVAEMAASAMEWQGIEIWRDGMVEESSEDGMESVQLGLHDVHVRGSKERSGRAIVCWRGDAHAWMNGTSADAAYRA